MQHVRRIARSCTHLGGHRLERASDAAISGSGRVMGDGILCNGQHAPSQTLRDRDNVLRAHGNAVTMPWTFRDVLLIYADDVRLQAAHANHRICQHAVHIRKEMVATAQPHDAVSIRKFDCCSATSRYSKRLANDKRRTSCTRVWTIPAHCGVVVVMQYCQHGRLVRNTLLKAHVQNGKIFAAH